MHGNSNTLCEEFTKGAKEAGHEVEQIYIQKKKIGACLGCNACYRNGGTCIQKDDMEEIREKMEAADVIVLSSPIYFYSMTAQMKTLVDRTYAFFQNLAGKTFYYIITCAATDESYTETMKASLQGFTCCVPDAVEGGTILGIGVSEAGEIKDMPVMKEAYEMGKNL